MLELRRDTYSASTINTLSLVSSLSPSYVIVTSLQRTYEPEPSGGENVHCRPPIYHIKIHGVIPVNHSRLNKLTFRLNKVPHV